MAESQSVIASPDFDTIAVKAGPATRDAIYLLWSVLNLEISQRRSGDQQLSTFLNPAAGNSDAGGTSQNNFNLVNATIWYFTGAAAFDLTGIRNGKEGMVRIFIVTGAGTMTVKNASGSSDAANRIVTSSGGDKSVTTNLAVAFIYLNSRWREWKPV